MVGERPHQTNRRIKMIIKQKGNYEEEVSAGAVFNMPNERELNIEENLAKAFDWDALTKKEIIIHFNMKLMEQNNRLNLLAEEKVKEAYEQGKRDKENERKI